MIIYSVDWLLNCDKF